MELLERYIKDLEVELKIDEFNLKEASLRLPARKHFWAAKLINHKRVLMNLESEKVKLRDELIEQLATKSPVKLTPSAASNAIDNTDKVKELTKKIAEEKLLIEFLEKTEKVMQSVSYDISNIVKIIQLEQL